MKIFYMVMVSLVLIFLVSICYFAWNKRRQKRVLEKIAFVDNVTGGNTYNKFLVDVQETLSNKINKQFYILSFDVDNFKSYNDTYGHNNGDLCLKHFAKAIQECFPEGSILGRYGGDEFMAVIYHTSQTEVEEILKCLCLEKDRLNNREDKMLIDYAYGWALSANDGKYTIQTLLDKADSYMYENKKLCKRYKRISEVESF